MILPHHSYRSSISLFTESRLIFEIQNAPSELEKELSRTLPEEMTDTAVDTLSQKINTPEASAVLRKIRESLQSLKPNERGNIQKNIERIEARIAVNANAKEQEKTKKYV